MLFTPSNSLSQSMQLFDSVDELNTEPLLQLVSTVFARSPQAVFALPGAVEQIVSVALPPQQKQVIVFRLARILSALSLQAPAQITQASSKLISFRDF